MDNYHLIALQNFVTDIFFLLTGSYSACMTAVSYVESLIFSLMAPKYRQQRNISEAAVWPLADQKDQEQGRSYVARKYILT